ncbi:MAG: hypothetical protein F4Y82_04560 [Cenarchaeum sp. SB0665_bin_23]|nr:hypothetical protein [Cenarchaeum sp. SB0665_bin_23]MYB47167.1 hypothetical protein [Cenarchaeum sp. SB0662_bin_33]MYG33249.1 hypothetical protein [Cenarchaeum sp. SB0677_bin_16]
MKRITLTSVILVTSICGMAYAQDFGGFGDSPFERDFGDIKYLDSYFGIFDSKVEVSPGDKNVPFTVVFANVGSHDITGIQGEMSLPYGFSPTQGRGLVIHADSNTNSMAGDTFHLTFYMDIAPYAGIQEYPAAVKLEFARLRESGVRNDFFDFYFAVPGSGILQVKTLDPFLMSLQTNTVRVQITNNGTAPLSNTDISTLGDQVLMAQNVNSNLENVVIYESSWELGNIAPFSSRHIDIELYIPETLKGETLQLPLVVEYIDANGETVSDTRVVDFYIRGFVDVSVYGIDTITISDTMMVIGEIINEGNEDALFGFVTLEPLGTSNIASQTQFIDEIDTSSPVPFNIPLSFDGEPIYGEHDIQITVRYKDDIREEHFFTHAASINVERPPPTEPNGTIPGLDVNSSIGSSSPLLLIITGVVVAVVIVGVVVAIRRRRDN